ncbi:hypothetical protein L493_2838 [Bordetella bronchiseptica 99-R-0433]|nr:hypothetical protein L493_2838 [Bordetella bronchiseptica 99-R-0433]
MSRRTGPRRQSVEGDGAPAQRARRGASFPLLLRRSIDP